MSRFFTNARDGIVLWRLALTNASLYFLITVGGAWLAATSSITAEQWTAMSSFDKSKIYIGIALTGFGVFRAFLDKTMSDIRDEQKDQPETPVAPPTKAS